MATVKLLLYDYYKKKDSNKVPLYIRIIHNRKPKYISLGILVDPEKDWDKANLRVRKSFPNSTKVNNFILKKLQEANELAIELESKNTTLTKKRIRNEIHGALSEDYIAFASLQIKRMREKGKIRTAKRYLSVLNKLERFRNGNPFTFDDFNLSFLHDYEAHLKSLGNDTNTIRSNFKVLRTMLYLAIREDKFPQEKNPFFKFKLKQAPTKKERLNLQEIELLSNIQLTKDTNIYHVRNAFLFSFYSAGIRVSDLFQLKWINVQNKVLDYRMGKTKKHRRLKSVKKAQDILDLYRTESSKPNHFIFPFLENEVDYSDEEFLTSQLSAKTTIFNNNLKKLMKRTGIQKNLSSHIARHSFADYARKQGMTIYDISKALGHSSLGITERYLSDFDDSSLDDAMESLFD